MLVFIVICLVFNFSTVSLAFENSNSKSAFLEYENKKKQLREDKQKVLKKYLQMRNNKRVVVDTLEGLFQSDTSDQFEKKRRSAFSKYKNKHIAYQKHQKKILENRLKKLQLIRLKNKTSAKQEFGFEFLK